MREEIIDGSDNVFITVSVSPRELTITFRPAGPCDNSLAIFVARNASRNRRRYTAVLKGADGGSGNGLVEVYKLGP